jgi:hypothetical protein
MEDVICSVSPVSSHEPEGPLRKISSDTNSDNASRTYDHTYFKVNKALHKYQTFYKDWKIIVERGIDAADVANRTPRVQMLLDAQWWVDMVENHHSAVVELVHEF